MMSEKKLKSVMSAILRVPVTQINEDTSKDTIQGWDSLNHMNLILALEEEFEITIPDEDVANLTSYALIKLVIEELSKGK